MPLPSHLPFVSEMAAQNHVVADGLVRRAAAGDQVAFARLVGEHHSAMMRVAYVIVGDADTARDAVQSAWTIAWRRLGTLRDDAQVNAWLVAIAGNEARQLLRRSRRSVIVDVSEADDSRCAPYRGGTGP